MFYVNGLNVLELILLTPVPVRTNERHELHVSENQTMLPLTFTYVAVSRVEYLLVQLA
jgi:hypothetical protein